MPNKTIYVSDDDLPLLERAQEVTGLSLSATVVAGLHRLVDHTEATDEGWEEITLQVGTGKGRQKRFLGAPLGEWMDSDAHGMQIYRVYRTRRGRFAVHHEQSQRFTNLTDDKGRTGWRAWVTTHLSADQTYTVTPQTRTLHVVDTLEELADLLPEDLYAIVAQAAQEPVVEELDI